MNDGAPKKPQAQPSANTPAMVAEEQRVLNTVQENLARLKTATEQTDYTETLNSLRESLSDERLPEDISSIMEQIDRTQALMNQQKKSVEGSADPMNPYFARMVLKDDFGQRSILIGKSTFISERIRIVDWRNAPISRLFYQYQEGEEYDEEVNGRDVSGEVLVRRMVTISEGELRRVSNEEATWIQRADGSWLDVKSREAKLSGGAGTAIRPDSLGTGHSAGRRDKHLPEIASLLDPDQFKLITAKDSGIVAIQGSAGSGKTTVGLHRVAWLAFQNPAEFRGENIIVVVFSRALSAYISQVLPALGVHGTKVWEYQTWASKLRQIHFKGFPDFYSDETPAVVIRFKTSVALLHMIEDLKHQPRHDGSLRELFEELFTDLDWIRQGLERYQPGAFSPSEIERIHQWCTQQHFLRDDGSGYNEDDRPSLDHEDDTILLRMHQVLKGPLRNDNKKPLVYDHLMVDEAQDLSPLELAVLIGTSGKRQSVTLAGDVAQKIMENREFPSWTAVLDALKLGHVHVSPLQVSYRSTRQIMEVARYILGPLAPDEPVTAPREGAPVGYLRFDSKGTAATWLGPALTDLMEREPMASVAVLCENMSQAIDWYQILDRSQVPHLSLVADQDFSFAPGIEVTDIRSSKGLEFDYVVLVGVDADTYPTRDEKRHLLHVGATRAAHQLWMIATGRPSPLVPEDLPGLD